MIQVIIQCVAQQVHSEKRWKIGNKLYLDSNNRECFCQAQNFYIYGTTLALSLTTEMVACQEAGIALTVILLAC